MEYRIYLDDKLVNICTNEYVLGSNVFQYEKRGEVRVEHVESTMDEEKREWLISGFNA